MMKKTMPTQAGMIPAGMYADGGKAKAKAKPFAGKESKAEEKAEMKAGKAAYRKGEMANGGAVGSKRSMPVKSDNTRGPGKVADFNRQDMKKMSNGGMAKKGYKC